MNATMQLEKTKHHPVMLDEILSIISPQHGGTFVDCTLGGGGYSRAILKHPNTKVIALDRDGLAKKHADKLKKEFPTRFNFVEDKFSNLNQIIKSNLNLKAIIFDLGLSSYQLSDNQRGFSFQSNSFLNMEMGLNECKAYDVVNTLEKKYLANIIKILGDEKDGKIIANKIANYRSLKKIKTSEELASIIKEAKTKRRGYSKNPATKTFQAIRIFVNKEITELISGLIEATKLLPKEAILLVVSFHSIEDKIVKNFLNLYSNSEKNPSRYLPIKIIDKNLFKIPFKKFQIPSKMEIKKNVRSRSAKLRYAIRNEKSFFLQEEFKKMFSRYLSLEDLVL